MDCPTPYEYENGTHSDGATEYVDSWENIVSLCGRRYFPEDEYEAPAPRRSAVKQEEKLSAEEQAEIAAMKGKLNWLGGVERKEKQANASDDEFPALGAEPKKRKVQYKKPVKGSKKTFTKFVISAKSYREERREQRQKSTDESEKRTAAFEILADKEGLEKKMTKTRMCNSVGKGKCRHGDKCRFAHSLDELKISTCFFGAKCRFVHTVEGKLVNKGGKKCDHKHPQESDDEFMARTGLDRYKPVVEKPVEAPKVIELPKYSAAQLKKMEEERKREAERVAKSMQKPRAWASAVAGGATPAPVKPTPLHIEPVEKETVMRVPKELAMQAMELAMKSGKKCIRVEII